MHILQVVGARPNFMKAWPVMRALQKWREARQTLVHTGQHFDKNCQTFLFTAQHAGAPDVNLEVGPAAMPGRRKVIKLLEPVLLGRKPDVVLVGGDVNSTVAGALVCSKLLIRVAHIEAGLRSFDRTMPKEIDRPVTDQLADLLITPSEGGDINLQREGVPPQTLYRVGNVMIDRIRQGPPRDHFPPGGSLRTGLAEPPPWQAEATSHAAPPINRFRRSLVP